MFGRLVPVLEKCFVVCPFAKNKIITLSMSSMKSHRDVDFHVTYPSYTFPHLRYYVIRITELLMFQF